MINTKFVQFCEELTRDIKQAYESSPTLEEAEKLAAKFLFAQIETAKVLQTGDLDARMRKSGLKAIKAAIYLDEVQKAEKKPSDVMLDALVTSNEIVQKEQNTFDESESDRDALQNYFDIFKDAHIFFRGIAKGNFSG